jgi:hypothetical protein
MRIRNTGYMERTLTHRSGKHTVGVLKKAIGLKKQTHSTVPLICSAVHTVCSHLDIYDILNLLNGVDKQYLHTTHMRLLCFLTEHNSVNGTGYARRIL